MFVRIPAAKKPEITFDMMLPACQIPIRNGLSFFVYQDEVMSDTAGRKGPSVTPIRNLQRQNAHADFMAGMLIVTADQANIHEGRSTRGFPLAM
jgi:hypothetical protein